MSFLILTTFSLLTFINISTATTTNQRATTKAPTTTHFSTYISQTPTNHLSTTANSSVKIPCDFDSDCPSHSICCSTSSTCRCNLGYENLQENVGSFACTLIHCKKNTDCLADFTNVRCYEGVCICDDNHLLDHQTQTCKYVESGSNVGTFIIGFSVAIGLVLLIVLLVFCCKTCRKRKSPGMILVPEGWTRPNLFCNFGHEPGPSDRLSASHSRGSLTPFSGHFENPNYFSGEVAVSPSSATSSTSHNPQSPSPGPPRTPPPQYQAQISSGSARSQDLARPTNYDRFQSSREYISNLQREQNTFFENIDLGRGTANGETTEGPPASSFLHRSLNRKINLNAL